MRLECAKLLRLHTRQKEVRALRSLTVVAAALVQRRWSLAPKVVFENGAVTEARPGARR